MPDRAVGVTAGPPRPVADDPARRVPTSRANLQGLDNNLIQTIDATVR